MGGEDYSRRYDANIDIRIRPLENLDSSQVFALHKYYYTSLIKKLNTNIAYRLKNETTIDLAGFSWRKVEYEFTDNKANLPTQVTKYINYSNKSLMQIVIEISNGEIKNIDKEVDCILSSIEIDNKSTQNSAALSLILGN